MIAGLTLWCALSSAEAKPLKANVLYFILVDRFQNGDLANDDHIDSQDPQAFHGGDLRGISKKLAHIQELGGDALWLSPIFEMRTEKFGGHGAFHGYWVQHLDGIEPRYGGLSALAELNDQLQQSSIPLIMDMVYNHVSFDSPMRTAHPDWFHPHPSIEDWNDPVQLTSYQVHGLPDLNQRRPPVYQYLLHRSKHWAGYSQGYRIDAIRHMESAFIKKIGEDLKQDQGADFWLLGEDFQGNPSALRQRAEDTKLDALFDFPLYYALTDTFCDQKSPMRLGGILWLDRYYPADLQLVRFLDNHDLPRIITRCGGSKKRATQALFFLLTVRGLPMLTYGTEVWLSGGHEPENRKSMPWNQLGTASDISAQITALTTFRKRFPVLSSGTGHIETISDTYIEYHQVDENHRSIYLYNGGQETLSPPALSRSIVAAVSAGERIQVQDPADIPDIAPGESLLLITPSVATKDETTPVTFKVAGAPEDRLMLVGSDPVVGSWNPAQGLELTAHRDGFWTVQQNLPTQAVICLKLVRKKDQLVVWSNGENHCFSPQRNSIELVPPFEQ